jgi:acyl dehydratase
MILLSVCALRARKKLSRVKKSSGLRQSSILNPFHLDEAAAEQTPLRGLAASGWHTAAIAMRLALEVRPFGPHPLLGIGVDELRWLAPVRPGDKLHLQGEVVELTPSETKPQGIVRVKWTLFNEHGDPVYTFSPINIVPRRPA